MPKRKTPLVNGEIYHIYNKSVFGIPIFTNKKEYKNFLLSSKFYLQSQPKLKFCFYKDSPDKYEVDLNSPLVEIITYCIMPTHYHFILRQLQESGIQNFIHRISNSHAHYFNNVRERKGPVFAGRFSAVRLLNESQYLHLNRYIHLNPVTAGLVEDPVEWDYSSYKTFLGLKKEPHIVKDEILSYFPTIAKYKNFVLDRKDYQRKLARLKDYLLE